MKLGIVGAEAAKFTVSGQRAARQVIAELLRDTEDPEVVSGACHLGGVDIWAEEAAVELRLPRHIYPPRVLSWAEGYKPRNTLIAIQSDEIHVIVVERLPDGYKGMRFDLCYHCGKTDHVKSGACWTAKVALHMGKRALWHYIRNG